MSMRSGFFNSVDGDRLYNAEDMTMPYRNLISNGVFPNPSSNLQVMTSSGMTVQVMEGSGMFGRCWAHNDAPVLLTLDAAPANLNRIDAVIAKCDNTEAVRAVNLEIKKGTPSSNPVVPEMLRSDNVNEYCLATVRIAPGTASITQSMITDTRADTAVCGWVTGLITQVDTSTLFKQWQVAYQEQYESNTEAFNAWFSSLKSILSDDDSAAAEIIRLSTYKADKNTLTVSLTAEGWSSSDGYFYQTVPADISENDLILVSPARGSEEIYAQNSVMATAQATGSLTFRANAAAVADVVIINMGTVV